MKKYFTLIFASLLINTATYAGILDGIFGYKNADDCVLDKIKGTTSDVAARLIYRSCAKYDKVDEPSCSNKIEIPNLTGNGSLSGGDIFNATIYNGSNLYTITKIDVRVTGKSGKSEFNQLLQGNASIRPLSNGTFHVKLGANSLTDMSWSIAQVYGCKK